ncbi:MAG: RagB/SusD family nutrient uptake outer membrane protein [Flavobacteriaceae bacterium]|nr:RagB/SusD family nutrient uptake outer membrane protein [Flavobacteriaceae bacterium]
MKKINLIVVMIIGAFFASCDDYLDVTPDNRTEVDNKSKIRSLLVSAYPNREYITLTELSSDNIMDQRAGNPNYIRFWEQVAYWEDITEMDNSAPRAVWEDSYMAIANANLALEAIDKLGNPKELSAERGEALITRAYSHFILVNVFCKHYNTQTSKNDLGIPYRKTPETTLSPKYDRGNVAEVYQQIDKDIEEALPLINDALYDVPAYHFTKRAAYAFAARFNLYYEKWEKAKKYATLVVTENPASVLRDWTALGEVPKDIQPKSTAYMNNEIANLLSVTASSAIGYVFGPWYRGSRFNHTDYLAKNETLFVTMPFNGDRKLSLSNYKNKPFKAKMNNFDKVLFFKIPPLFEVTDAVQRTGFTKTVLIPFTTDETLLVRAEAEVMLGENEKAVEDLNIWANNYFKPKKDAINLTVADINTFYDSLEYSSADAVSPKKKLNPKFSFASKEQENLIHYVLQCRRILTLEEGLRWFDVKRYGIVINRKQGQIGGAVRVVKTLEADDNRKAIQLPFAVINAGLKANPR